MADIADRPLGAELGDINGDFDLDILMGARNSQPRIFNNRLEQNGGVLNAFVDVTFASHVATTSNAGNYEQEFGRHGQRQRPRPLRPELGAGRLQRLHHAERRRRALQCASRCSPGSSSDDNEGDWFDYNNDGNLDLFVANFSGQ